MQKYELNTEGKQKGAPISLSLEQQGKGVYLNAIDSSGEKRPVVVLRDNGTCDLITDNGHFEIFQ